MKTPMTGTTDKLTADGRFFAEKRMLIDDERVL